MEFAETRHSGELRNGDVGFDVNLDEGEYPLQAARIELRPLESGRWESDGEARIPVQKSRGETVCNRLHEESPCGGFGAHFPQNDLDDLLDQRVAKATAIQHLRPRDFGDVSRQRRKRLCRKVEPPRPGRLK